MALPTKKGRGRGRGGGGGRGKSPNEESKSPSKAKNKGGRAENPEPDENNEDEAPDPPKPTGRGKRPGQGVQNIGARPNVKGKKQPTAEALDQDPEEKSPEPKDRGRGKKRPGQEQHDASPSPKGRGRGKRQPYEDQMEISPPPKGRGRGKNREPQDEMETHSKPKGRGRGKSQEPQNEKVTKPQTKSRGRGKSQEPQNDMETPPQPKGRGRGKRQHDEDQMETSPPPKGRGRGKSQESQNEMEPPPQSKGRGRGRGKKRLDETETDVSPQTKGRGRGKKEPEDSQEEGSPAKRNRGGRGGRVRGGGRGGKKIKDVEPLNEPTEESKIEKEEETSPQRQERGRGGRSRGRGRGRGRGRDQMEEASDIKELDETSPESFRNISVQRQLPRGRGQSQQRGQRGRGRGDRDTWGKNQGKAQLMQLVEDDAVIDGMIDELIASSTENVVQEAVTTEKDTKTPRVSEVSLEALPVKEFDGETKSFEELIVLPAEEIVTESITEPQIETGESDRPLIVNIEEEPIVVQDDRNSTLLMTSHEKVLQLLRKSKKGRTGREALNEILEMRRKKRLMKKASRVQVSPSRDQTDEDKSTSPQIIIPVENEIEKIETLEEEVAEPKVTHENSNEAGKKEIEHKDFVNHLSEETWGETKFITELKSNDFQPVDEIVFFETPEEKMASVIEEEGVIIATGTIEHLDQQGSPVTSDSGHLQPVESDESIATTFHRHSTFRKSGQFVLEPVLPLTPPTEPQPQPEPQLEPQPEPQLEPQKEPQLEEIVTPTPSTPPEPMIPDSSLQHVSNQHQQQTYTYDTTPKRPSVFPISKQPAEFDPTFLIQQTRSKPEVVEVTYDRMQKVKVKVVISRITDIDTVGQQFDAEIYIQARWTESNFQGKSEEELDSIPFSQCWNPKLVILNLVGGMEKDRLSIMVRYEPEETYPVVTFMWFVKATFAETMELEHFPFDTQEISLILSSDRSLDEIDIIPDNQNVSEVTAGAVKDAQEWKPFRHVEFMRDFRRSDFFGTSMHPILLASGHVRRRLGFYMWNFFIVIFIIIGLSLTILSIEATGGDRLGVTMTLFLTCVAFKLVVKTTLPHISYLTYLDVYLVFTLMYLGAQAAENAIIAHLSRYRKKEKVIFYDEIAQSILLGLLVLFHAAFLIYIQLTAFKRRRLMDEKEYNFHLELKKKRKVNTAYNNENFKSEKDDHERGVFTYQPQETAAQYTFQLIPRASSRNTSYHQTQPHKEAIVNFPRDIARGVDNNVVQRFAYSYSQNPQNSYRVHDPLILPAPIANNQNGDVGFNTTRQSKFFQSPHDDDLSLPPIVNSSDNINLARRSAMIQNQTTHSQGTPSISTTYPVITNNDNTPRNHVFFRSPPTSEKEATYPLRNGKGFETNRDDKYNQNGEQPVNTTSSAPEDGHRMSRGRINSMIMERKRTISQSGDGGDRNMNRNISDGSKRNRHAKKAGKSDCTVNIALPPNVL